MNKYLRAACMLPALMFLAMGVRWIIDPASAAAELGMDLMSGRGLSSQMGDVGGFFMGAAIMTMLGVVTLNKTWLQAGALLTALAAIYRVIATTVHGADLVVDAIAIEIVITALLLFGASRIKPENESNVG